MKKLFKQDRAFTLIEILIAIALLAVIVAIVVPNITGFMSREEWESYKTEKINIQSAVDAYYKDPSNKVAGTSRFPTSSYAGSDSPGYSYGRGSSYISFTMLVSGKYINDYPSSAAPTQNGSSAFAGSYGWYVDRNGKVQSSPAWSSSIGFP